MRLPTMSSVPDYTAPKKGKGRTRKNYTSALFDMPKQKRGRKPKAFDPNTAFANLAPKRKYVKKETQYNARGFPIAKSVYVPTGKPRGRPKKATDPNAVVKPKRTYTKRETVYNARGFPIGKTSASSAPKLSFSKRTRAPKPLDFTKYSARGFPIPRETKKPKKPQPPNTVLNPLTGRYVKIDGLVHLKLLRAGVFSTSVASG
jgi:hypothetical protein